MKVKVWTDSAGRLLNWANMNDTHDVGPTDDGQQIIEVDTTDNLYEGHASIVNGVVVPDSGYTPDVDRPAVEESDAQKITSLQQSNDELQSALLELSDLVLSGGGSK
ncbi:hypothetical protein lb338_phage_123 [Lactobacillus phage Lb338-1]|uniref:Uncharacterized protein n=1 Tax=Lactobacillus phage Lb338-1 TaxID=2892342 RepID=C1KFN3_9CAUD|nr:hypothetical protein lb338_phage_123 [Lactobacillus phage Lb338-1]ACO37044.1 hypothetical protein lb338_phage_123 [Lactobacillus phage Lb338-1]